MTSAELHAKAQRAAEWLEAQGYTTCYREFPNGDAGWNAVQKEPREKFCRMSMKGSDRILIAFAEDRGWHDDHIGDANKMVEADGVEWELVTERALIGTIEVHVYAVDGLWTWDLLDTANSDNVRCEVASMKPTREEARRQAVEAVRALGMEGE